jgi:hypothetical protein
VGQAIQSESFEVCDYRAQENTKQSEILLQGVETIHQQHSRRSQTPRSHLQDLVKETSVLIHETYGQRLQSQTHFESEGLRLLYQE